MEGNTIRERTGRRMSWHWKQEGSEERQVEADAVWFVMGSSQREALMEKGEEKGN